MGTGEKLLTVKEAAEYLSEKGMSFSVPTLNTWRCRGRGPRFRKIMAAVRYTTPDLDEFAQGGVVETRDTMGAL